MSKDKSRWTADGPGQAMSHPCHSVRKENFQKDRERFISTESMSIPYTYDLIQLTRSNNLFHIFDTLLK